MKLVATDAGLVARFVNAWVPKSPTFSVKANARVHLEPIWRWRIDINIKVIGRKKPSGDGISPNRMLQGLLMFATLA